MIPTFEHFTHGGRDQGKHTKRSLLDATWSTSDPGCGLRLTCSSPLSIYYVHAYIGRANNLGLECARARIVCKFSCVVPCHEPYGRTGLAGRYVFAS
jgi:hypothetical protein